jgi:N-acetyl-anhydromuramyl-L-alanine amidase AmpD
MSVRVVTIIGELAHGRKAYERRQGVEIKRIVVHHAGVNDASAESMATYHVRKRGWPGIGYHYVITRGGGVYKCQPLLVVSNHCGKYNREAIGVCLIGNFETRYPTPGQLEAGVELVAELAVVYHVGAACIQGHREVVGARTLCPGALLDMPRFREAVERVKRRGTAAQEGLYIA